MTKFSAKNFNFWLIYIKKVSSVHHFLSNTTTFMSENAYLCIVFFIVLDLRLTKDRGSAEPLFLCLSSDTSVKEAEQIVECHTCHQASQSINGIVGIDINR